MKKAAVRSPEKKEAARHGEAFFPVRKYITTLQADYPAVTTHWHEEAELTLITEGSALYQIDLADYETQSGDLLFVPPMLLHAITLSDSSAFTSETYVFHLNFLGGNSTDVCSTRYLIPLMNEELRVPCLIRPNHPAYRELLQLFHQLNRLHGAPAIGYELAMKALFLQAVFLLLQYGERRPAAQADTSSGKLKQVLDYIAAHCTEPITVSDLAALCYFSDYHFMRFFKKHMNMTCIEYINSLRLEKAVALFEQGNTSILDVSLSAGFHNLSYFHKVFKRKYHMTPKAFLRQLEEAGKAGAVAK